MSPSQRSPIIGCVVALIAGAVFGSGSPSFAAEAASTASITAQSAGKDAGKPTPGGAASDPADKDGKDKDKDKDDDHGTGKPIVIPAAALGALGITLGSPVRRALVEPIHASGQVIYDPDGQALVGGLAPGTITALRAKLGDRVQAGQALAEVASAEFVRTQNDFLLKTALAAGAKAALAAAQRAADRSRSLGDGGISQAEQERRDSDRQQAEAAWSVASAERDAAAVTLRLYGFTPQALEALLHDGASPTYTLRAPMAGMVVERDSVLGAQVAADGRSLFALADPARLWIVADVPESQIPAASLGSEAVVTDLAGARLGEGDIGFIQPGIDQRTRTGRVRVTLAKADAVMAGMFVQVAITPVEAEGGAQVLALPEAAVVRLGEKNVVFVGIQTGDTWSFSAHPVIAGPAIGGWTPVATGVDGDDHVVVGGAVLLKAEAGKSSVDND